MYCPMFLRQSQMRACRASGLLVAALAILLGCAPSRPSDQDKFISFWQRCWEPDRADPSGVLDACTRVLQSNPVPFPRLVTARIEPRLRLSRCEALIATGQAALAVEECDKAIRPEGSDFYAAWDMRGRAYAALGQYERAIADFDQAIRIYPACGYYQDRGKAHLALHHRRQADADFANDKLACMTKIL